MKILAIDPGSKVTGLAWREDNGKFRLDFLEFKRKKHRTVDDKVVDFFDEMCKVLDKVEPECIFYEETFMRGQRAIKAAHYLQALFKLAAGKRNIPVMDGIQNTTWKSYFNVKRQSGKNKVAALVCEVAGIEYDPFFPDDCYDALGLLLYAETRIVEDNEDEMPD